MNTEIETYKIRHGYKELPIWFYFQGMFFWIIPVALAIAVIWRVFQLPFWLGLIIIIPYCGFWGLKAFRKYKNDKL